MDDRHRIGSATLSAVIAAQGAELVGLQDAAGAELIWHAGPEWPRHAPVLFPIVGRLADDTLIHDGRRHRLTQHGFARDSLFEWVERSPSRAVLELVETAATLAAYPFRFRLSMIYEVEGNRLSVTSRIDNPGDTTLPCGIGAHPAFRWPLVDGLSKESHSLEFDAVEPGPAQMVQNGLLGSDIASPVEGRRLPLSPALFENDAIVLRNVASRSVRFVAHDGDGEAIRSLTVAWRGYKDLGLWSKPSGAPFLCIEPWFSTTSPVGWQGNFSDKPGILLLPPGDSRDFVWTVEL